MFFFKKIVGAFLMPIPIGLFILFLALIFLLTNSYGKAKFFSFLAFLWFVLLSSQPVSNFIIKPLEDSHKALLNPPVVKHILVLGSGHVSNDELSITSQLRSVAINRLSEGLRLKNEIKDSKIIVSGYKGFDQTYHSVMSEKFLISQGVNKNNIIRLEKPVDTKQEAVEAKKIVGTNEFILVTSASHMKRAMLLFKKEGLNPIAAPTYHMGFEDRAFNTFFSSFNLYKVKIATHEYLGLIWSYIRGLI